MERQRFYFTFGIGTNLADCYVVIEARDDSEARWLFYDTRRRSGMPHPGDGWAFVYPESDWLTLNDSHRPTNEIPVETPVVWL